MTLKNVIKQQISRSFFFSLASFLTRNTPRIFVYHRFDTTGNCSGIYNETFAWQLKQLSKKWRVITLGDYLELKTSKAELPPYLVILTVDDGYVDFYNIAYPLLLEARLPATLFVTVNFVDRKVWLWPDRVMHALRNHQKKQLTLELSGEILNYNLDDSAERKTAWNKIIDYCVKVEDKAKGEFISGLEKQLKVIPPPLPPEEYAAVTWEELREMSKHKIEIGSHTMNHPILSRTPEEKLEDEIGTSKKIIEKKLGRAVNSFCYPNGQPPDINEKVVQTVKDAGYGGAVQINTEKYDLFMLPREGVTNDKTDFLWKLAGMEKLTSTIRSVFSDLKRTKSAIRTC